MRTHAATVSYQPARAYLDGTALSKIIRCGVCPIFRSTSDASPIVMANRRLYPIDPRLAGPDQHLLPHRTKHPEAAAIPPSSLTPRFWTVSQVFRTAAGGIGGTGRWPAEGHRASCRPGRLRGSPS